MDGAGFSEFCAELVRRLYCQMLPALVVDATKRDPDAWDEDHFGTVEVNTDNLDAGERALAEQTCLHLQNRFPDVVHSLTLTKRTLAFRCRL